MLSYAFERNQFFFVKRLFDNLRYEAKRGRDKIRVSKPVNRAAFLTGIGRITLFRIDNEKNQRRMIDKVENLKYNR